MPRRTRAEVEASMAARRQQAAEVEQIMQIAEDLSAVKTVRIDFIMYPGETPHAALEEVLKGFSALGGIYLGVNDANGHHSAEVTGEAILVDDFLFQYQETAVGLNPADPIY